MTTSERISKISTIITAIGALLIPIVVNIQGNRYTKAFKEKEKELRFVELSIDILNQDKIIGDSSLRKWAIDVLNTYSEIPFTEDIKKDLTNDKIKLPKSDNINGTQSGPLTPYSATLIDELSKKNLLDNICRAANQISSKTPSPNTALQACNDFRDVIKNISLSVLSKEGKILLEQANKNYDLRSFDNAAPLYKAIFNECYKSCNN